MGAGSAAGVSFPCFSFERAHVLALGYCTLGYDWVAKVQSLRMISWFAIIVWSGVRYLNQLN